MVGTLFALPALHLLVAVGMVGNARQGCRALQLPVACGDMSSRRGEISMSSSTSATLNDTCEIYASLERLVNAVNTNDLDGIMKYYVPDNVPGETLVVFDGIPPRQYVGAAAFRQDWATFLASCPRRRSCRGQRLEKRVRGQLGVWTLLLQRHGYRQGRQPPEFYPAHYRRLQEDQRELARHPRARFLAREPRDPRGGPEFSALTQTSLQLWPAVRSP